MYTIIRKHELQTTRWSGGTTTQLAIYPPTAQYAERNFQWRISSAQVEDPLSTFTSLPGVARILMILDGKMSLHHKGHGDANLHPLEQSSFWGDWITTSKGVVTDFNLMLAQGQGKVEALKLTTQQSYSSNLSLDKRDKDDLFPLSRSQSFTSRTQASCLTEIYYVYQGDNCTIHIEDEQITLHEGDVWLQTHPTSQSYPPVNIQVASPSILIRSVILHPL